MFEWECDPARDGRLTIAEYREQVREKVGRRAAISGHMGPKRDTAANLVKVRCTLDQVFDSFARGNHLAFLTLEARPSNTAAIALYQGFGFREVGRRRNYYDLPKEDALILTKYYTEEAAQ